MPLSLPNANRDHVLENISSGHDSAGLLPCVYSLVVSLFQKCSLGW